MNWSTAAEQEIADCYRYNFLLQLIAFCGSLWASFPKKLYNKYLACLHKILFVI